MAWNDEIQGRVVSIRIPLRSEDIGPRSRPLIDDACCFICRKLRERFPGADVSVIPAGDPGAPKRAVATVADSPDHDSAMAIILENYWHAIDAWWDAWRDA